MPKVPKPPEPKGASKLEDVGLTESEERFFKEASAKLSAKIWRAGWPDFLMHSEAHGYIGVEVKSDGDKLSDSQKRMFAALELAGIKTFVWWTKSHDRLIPWRKFLHEAAIEKMVKQWRGGRRRTARELAQQRREKHESRSRPDPKDSAAAATKARAPSKGSVDRAQRILRKRKLPT